MNKPKPNAKPRTKKRQTIQSLKRNQARKIIYELVEYSNPALKYVKTIKSFQPISPYNK